MSGAGYAEFSATVAGANHNAEIGHALYTEAKDAFDGAADVDPAANTITNVSATWAVGDPVQFWNSGGATPTGLTDGATYFLVSVATTNVTLSLTKGGAVVVPSDQGNDATQYLQNLLLSVVHVF